jgi:hypothetical protein
MKAEARSMMALLTLLGACSSAEHKGTWGAGSFPGYCIAMRQGGDEALTLSLGYPGPSGIAIRARPFDAAVPDLPQENITLLINGKRVLSHAAGLRFGGSEAGAGIGIEVNLRALLGRHPHGFVLAVVRDGSEIYQDEIGDAARQSIEEMTACDRARRRSLRSS